MKNKLLILSICFSSYSGISQTETAENFINPDVIIGEYGISLKNKTIGRYHIYDCSDEDFHAECYGYFKTNTINFDTTTLVFIGNELKFKEDLILDLESIKIIDSGNDSGKDSQKRDPIYIDKNNAYNSLYKNGLISNLYNFKHLNQNYFINNDELAYLDQFGFYILTNSNVIDKTTFKPIIKNLFYDKNGVYYVEYGHSEIDNKKYSEIITLQDLKTSKKPSILIKENYCVINDKVYDLNRFENEIQLDPNNIKEIILNDFSGAMLLHDDKTIYERSQKHYRFNKATCETEYEKTELQCLFKDFSTIKTLRKTRFTEYHINLDKKILYFDANKNLNLTETSGNLYKVGNDYYFTDNDRFSTQINAIKIWNPKIDSYENIDLDNYHHLHNETYYYKGNLYGHHSKIKQANFNIINAQVLSTNYQSYITNNEQIIDVVDSKKLNLTNLKVLKTKYKEPTNYLIGNDFLIYKNQIIKNIETRNIEVLTTNILKTKYFLINEGEKIALSAFPFKIMTINK